MGYRSGDCVGTYKILRFLGRGTFGEVLLACDRKEQQDLVALKTVACDQLSTDAAERARSTALSEARLLRQLRHPHIVGCREVQWDAERQTVWFALEYLDGGDVQSLIDARKQCGAPSFEDHFVRRVLASVGSALRYVHEQDVLHRDVKPANVLLARGARRIKLGDFGVSKLLEATGRARTVVGTPYYLSPEIVSGQAYGGAADAWALGVCLHELVALRRPFEAANPLALVRRICEEPPSQVPPNVAADVHCAIVGLLEKDQYHRMTIADALAVSDAVAVLATGPVGDESPGEVFCGRACAGAYLDLSPRLDSPAVQPSLENCSELSPLSMLTSEGEGSPMATEISTLLRGLMAQAPSTSTSKSPCATVTGTMITNGVAPATTAGGMTCTFRSRPEREAIEQARVALRADIDDPEDLRLALSALEEVVNTRQAASPLADAVESLRSELQLRIAALRADAAALLESLIEQPADSVCTRIMPAESCGAVDVGIDTQASGTAAIESAIGFATSLGLDTGAAEEKAAFTRALLSVRAVWGLSVRCCLLPLSMPFKEVVHEISRRFGIHSGFGGVGVANANAVAGALPLDLCWRDGVETMQLRDQVSWESCLRRCGLLVCGGGVRPGRLEVHVMDPPFAVMGTRFPGSVEQSAGVVVLPARSPAQLIHAAGSQAATAANAQGRKGVAASVRAGQTRLIVPTPGVRGGPGSNICAAAPRGSSGPRASAARPSMLRAVGLGRNNGHVSRSAASRQRRRSSWGGGGSRVPSAPMPAAAAVVLLGHAPKPPRAAVVGASGRATPVVLAGARP
eukprot:TRINITY_DN9285_c0_g1_i2.p1 TRINITY_DN9285_c0_g1~~TRINITY_DN9285_c0_g1_i2.p1  ORF type:complete len:803 (-),score=126.76 TRINITY_DN9285_c0_g1_i2:386-2794(-)